MIDDRDLLERGLPGLEPAPGMTERVYRRRDRKRRRQRIGAGVVGILLAIAVGLAVRPMFSGQEPAETPSPTPAPVEPVGFIGVPPEGAEPSTPVEGELVLSLDTTVSGGDPYKTTLYVYADGRLIWERHAEPTGVPEGAGKRGTGYLEQLLTPEGVEALRSEVVESGLFEHDVHLRGAWEEHPDIYGTQFSVLRGDRTVSLEWAAGYPDERHPTQDEIDAIRALVQRLRDPGAWLPETAWVDRTIRAYVASNYWVGFSLVTKPDGDCCLKPDPSEMPPPAGEILDRELNQCITTDEARALVEAFGAAGLVTGGKSWEGPSITYETGATGHDGVPQFMRFDPLLPDRKCP